MERDETRTAHASTDGAPREHLESDLDAERLHESGGLRYQQAHRQPGRTRSSVDEPDQQQRAEEYGGPDPDDQSRLRDHGYPKLGKSAQSTVTQVEHGPYAGGTQQGDAETRDRG